MDATILGVVAIVAIAAMTITTGKDRIARDAIRALVDFFRRKK